MNNDKSTKQEEIKEKYKVNYFFSKSSKININEVLKKSFLLSLNAKGKIM